LRSAVFGVLGMLTAACQTVDLGAPPADVNACEPGQQWFIDQIWPNFLAQGYGGKHCYDVSCHAIGSPNGLILTVPVEPGASNSMR